MTKLHHPLPRCFLALVLLLALAPALARVQAAERLPDAVARALLAAHIPRTAVAIVVQEASASRPSLSVNAGLPMNPGSAMKLLTTYAALDTLGPAYIWKTEAWVTGTLAHGVLDGDLYLKGGGDPMLTFERFWLLLRNLRARGIRVIRGDLVLDRGLFDAGEQAPFDDQPLRPYNVKPDALLLNFKALRLQFIPDPGQDSVAVLAEPRPEGLTIASRVQPVTGDCGDWKEGLKFDLPENDERLTLSGNYPLACGEKSLSLGVLSHPQYVLGVFRQLWRELGGTIGGLLRDGAVPADARFVTDSESPPLAEVVRDINKFSNNVMARQLFLTLGLGPDGRSAGPADAGRAVRAWLARKDLRFPELVLENGSGLSRSERLGAGSLAKLLADAWRSPVMPEFVASLPIAGVDGTMKKRLGQAGVAGRAHIKTGSLDGVKAIAGYVLDRKGRWQIVVFLVNDAHAAAAREAQDALLQWVYQRGPGG